MAESFGRADVTKFLEEMTLADYLGWLALWAGEVQQRDRQNIEAMRELQKSLEKRARQNGAK